MDQQRQEAFQKLRPPCVDLSSVGLRFKARQVAIKDVLHALEAQYRVLQELSLRNLLDAKLAEYAFFPLTHVFNESQRMSPRCLQVAVQSCELLVSHGWRQRLAPEMGKQLLILMSLLAGGDPRKQTATATDELKSAVFECVAAVIKWLASGPSGQSVLVDNNTKNIVDQLTYLFAENLSESIDDAVQLSAGQAMSELFSGLSDRVFLASLLPRTVSSLVKALRPSTQARRTHKVLCHNLILLRLVLYKVLSGNVVAQAQPGKEAEAEALNESWLKATSAQVRNALAQVVKLRNHDRTDVKEALADLCIMILEDCSRSLPESRPVMLETLVILSENHAGTIASTTVKRLLVTQPDLVEILRSNFYDWAQALPRIMQANDDAPKEMMIKKIASAFDLISDDIDGDDTLSNTLTTTLLNSVGNTIEQLRGSRMHLGVSDSDLFPSIETQAEASSQSYQQVIFNHQTQQLSAYRLSQWIGELKQSSCFGKISRTIVDTVANTAGVHKVSALWLAVQLLKRTSSKSFDIEDLIIVDSSRDRSTSRTHLIHDLYMSTRDLLIDASPFLDQEKDWRITALSLEALSLQAQQMGRDYRNELYETLYPVLALFSSGNEILRHNAVTTLNLLASSCEYSSAKEMLIENVDYLVNSIAWKLNTFNLSPEAPWVLNMVVRLVGARLMPYLDDLIASIFTALDSYHGYPAWVEMLFTVLKTMVEESAQQPNLAITYDQQHETTRHEIGYRPTNVTNIVEDLRAWKKRKLVHGRGDTGEDDMPEPTPQRLWTRERDNPAYQPAPSHEEDLSLESLLKQDEEGDLPAPSANQSEKDEDLMKPQSKSHDLLLQIAQATAPHLSSPSPRVRNLLLQLLQQISPILARHENTFLPLINAIWPAVVSRLFADQISTSERRDHETASDTMEYPYNIAAAAELTATLCARAQGFMSNRVEQIFKQLIRLFKQTYSHVTAGRRAKQAIPSHRPLAAPRQDMLSTYESTPKPLSSSTGVSSTKASKPDGSGISGAVNLHFVKQPLANQVQPSSTNGTLPTQSQDITVSRSSQSQILTSLITLLTSILEHVPLSPDLTDEIILVLEPFVLDTPVERVVRALDKFNPDIVWLVKMRGQIETEIEAGARSGFDRSWTGSRMPELGAGLGLMEVVF